jgi:hypothetical protein
MLRTESVRLLNDDISVKDPEPNGLRIVIRIFSVASSCRRVAPYTAAAPHLERQRQRPLLSSRMSDAGSNA